MVFHPEFPEKNQPGICYQQHYPDSHPLNGILTILRHFHYSIHPCSMVYCAMSENMGTHFRQYFPAHYKLKYN